MTMAGLLEWISKFLFGEKRKPKRDTSVQDSPEVAKLKNLFAFKKQFPQPIPNGPETFANEIGIMYRRFLITKTFLTGTSENTQIISFRDKGLIVEFHKDLNDLYDHLEFAKNKFKMKQTYSKDLNETYDRILQAVKFLKDGTYYTGGYESFNQQFPFVEFEQKLDPRVIKYVCTRLILILKVNVYTNMHPIYRSYALYVNIIKTFKILQKKATNEDNILRNRSFQ